MGIFQANNWLFSHVLLTDTQQVINSDSLIGCQPTQTIATRERPRQCSHEVKHVLVPISIDLGSYVGYMKSASNRDSTNSHVIMSQRQSICVKSICAMRIP